MLNLQRRRKIISTIFILIALSFVGLIIVREYQEEQADLEAQKAGLMLADKWASGFEIYNDFGLPVAFLLTSISIWSKRAAQTAIVIAVVISLGIYIIVPDHANFVEYHISAALVFMLGMALILRGKDHLWVTLLGCIHIFGSYIFWYFRENEGRKNAEIAPLSFTIILDNILHKGFCASALFAWVLTTKASMLRQPT